MFQLRPTHYLLKVSEKGLQIEPDTWMTQVNHFGKRHFRLAGSKDIIKSTALKVGLKCINGQGKSSPFESPLKT